MNLKSLERGQAWLDEDQPKLAADWPEPQPICAVEAALPYPADALPGDIGEAVREVHAFAQAPLPLVVASAMGAVSVAVQSLVDIERADKLRGPSGLFLLSLADSGERKSTCDSFFTTAIREFENEQVEVFAPAVRQYRADLEAWESVHAGLKDRIRSLSRSGKDTRAAREQIRDHAELKPSPPRIPRLIYTDATPEALAHGLASKWPSGGVVSAEAGLVFGAHGMGRESIMRNLALLNQLWDGGSVRIDRKTSDGFAVHGARLTVALQIQPATLRSFFDTSKGLARGTGFLSRFLIARPESTQGTRLFREAPKAWPALTKFNSRLAEVLNSEQPLDGSELRPQVLRLSPEAQGEWVLFHDEIESELSVGGELADVRDVASKTADNAARIAALFHVFSGQQGAISNEHFKPASRIAAWHLNEARRFFGELCLPDELTNAQRLDDWVLTVCRTSGSNRVPTSQVLQFGPPCTRKRSALEDAAKELEELGRARLMRSGRAKFIEVNPALLAGGE